MILFTDWLAHWIALSLIVLVAALYCTGILRRRK